MPPRRIFVTAAVLLLGLAAFLLLRPGVGEALPGSTPPGGSVRPSTAPSPSTSGSASGTPSATPGSQPPAAEPAGSPIADALNAPDGTIRHDLQILDELFGAFHTNFPRLGNPVGENAEITAALTGANPAKFVFISPRHRAINARGELCDRWGTPFRFHQVSGTQMEIRSAGPDRKFATGDDAEFAPGTK